MPLYRVRVKNAVSYTTEVSADTEDAAMDLAVDEAVVPHMGDGWDADGEAEVESIEKIAEDGEYDVD